MTDTGETVHGTSPPTPASQTSPISVLARGPGGGGGNRSCLGVLHRRPGGLVQPRRRIRPRQHPRRDTLHVDHAATYYVFAEGARWFHPSVQVTGPEGHAAAVGATSPGPSYYHGGNQASAVGKFRAAQPGGYKVAVSTGTTVQGGFAVGGSFPLWMRLSDWEALALLVLFAVLKPRLGHPDRDPATATRGCMSSESRLAELRNDEARAQRRQRSARRRP